VRPGTPSKERAKADGSKEKTAPTISNAMMNRLSIQVTQATQKAITEEPRVGLVALLAGFFTRSDGPVRVHTTGMGGNYGDRESFTAAFERLQAMSDEELFRVAAGVAGQALDMQSQNVLRAPLSKGAEVLAAAIDADRMNAALGEAFDAVDYFNGVAKLFVITAIR
jgi:ParB family chromosome partitioning protein